MNWIGFVVWTMVTLGVVTIGVWLSRYFGNGVFYGLYAVLTVVANIIASKLITIGPFVVPAAVLTYSVSFLITDLIDEKFGQSEGHKVVMTGFVANVIAMIMIMMAVKWDAAPFVGKDFISSFNNVLGFVPRVVVASTISYLISQNHDVWAFHYWKKRTGGKWLWLRNNASTMVSQLIDTVIFISIAFYGVVPNNVLFSMMYGQYIVKFAVAALDTPFAYLGVWMIDKVHGNAVSN